MTQLFFLQSTARSGTAWLGSYFAAHPDIEWFGEMFHPALFPTGYYASLVEKVATDPEVILPHKQSAFCTNYLSALSNQRTLISGIDLKLEHLELLPYIRNCIYQRQFKFIVLRRLNLLKQMVSELIMYERIKQGDLDVHRSYVPARLSIHISPEVAIGMMAEKHEAAKRYSERIQWAGSPSLWLIYENMCLPGGIETTLREIEGFLEIGGFGECNQIVKQNPFPMEELVVNWDELSRAVSRSRFAYTLHLPG